MSYRKTGQTRSPRFKIRQDNLGATASHRINIAIVGLAIWLTPNVSMDLAGALLSSFVMSLVNGVVNFWVSPYTSK